MEHREITVNVVIDAVTFRRFALFDLLRVRRVWRLPAVFVLLMAVFAGVCYLMRARAGGVLLAAGLGLPAFYACALLLSVRAQIKSYGLKTPQAVYSLTLSEAPDGVAVANPAGQSARYEWKRLYGVYRHGGCVYLYVTKNKAFLLPEGQAEGGDAWELVCRMAANAPA